MSIEVKIKGIVYGEIKPVGKGVKFSICSSEKNKKTDEWESTYFDVLCFGEHVDAAHRFAVEKTKLFVSGKMNAPREYKGKTYLSMFARQIEPMSNDTYDKVVEKVFNDIVQKDEHKSFTSDEIPF